MTSSPVMGTRGIADFGTQVTRETRKTDFTDFKSFMNQSQNKLDSLTNEASGKNGREAVKENKVKAVEKDKKVEAKEKTSTISKDDNVQTVSKENVDEVKDAIEDVKKILKDELDIADEEIEAILETLGLTQMALLDAESLPIIVSGITGAEDALAIAMDESVFESFSNIAQAIDNAVESLAGKVDAEVDEIKEAVSMFKSADAEITPVTDGVAELMENVSEKETKEDVITEAEETFESKLFVVNKDRNGKNDAMTENRITETETANIQETKITADFKKSGNFEQHGSQNNAPMTFVENLMARVAESLAEETSEVTYSSFDAQNIMNQLTDYIKVDLSMDNPEVSMRLHPETLGTVSVKVSANNEGVLTAQFITQNESVKAVIESQALVLRESLEAKGVTVEAVEVLVQSHEFERNLSDQNRGNETGNNNGSAKRTRRINLLDEEENIESEEDNLVRSMMIQNGNTVDYSA